MKKLVAKFLVLTLLVCSFSSHTVAAVECRKKLTDWVDKDVTENANGYNKLHFYFDVEEYEIIDDVDELESAIDLIPQKGTDSSTYRMVDGKQESCEITVTV